MYPWSYFLEDPAQNLKYLYDKVGHNWWWAELSDSYRFCPYFNTSSSGQAADSLYRLRI